MCLSCLQYLLTIIFMWLLKNSWSASETLMICMASTSHSLLIKSENCVRIQPLLNPDMNPPHEILMMVVISALKSNLTAPGNQIFADLQRFNVLPLRFVSQVFLQLGINCSGGNTLAFEPKGCMRRLTQLPCC